MSNEEDAGPDLSDGVELSELGEGSLMAGSLDGEPVVLVNDRGRICAISGKCTHLGAPLKDGILVDGQLRCPWHHARFSLETGEAVAAPAFQCLDRFEVDRRGDRLFVTKSSGQTVRAAIAPKRVPAVLIVGGGAAGFACAELLSRSGFGGGVTVISDDPEPPYDRTFCSKQYLIGLASREECFLSGANFPSADGPVILISQRVAALHLDAKEVELDNGERLAFDSLVLATGAEPMRPDFPGSDRLNVHVLRTLRDADAIIADASKGKRAAVIGASFIGLEVAASLRQREVAVDVIAPGKIPLEKILGPAVGTMIRGVDEAKGVRFHLGCKPARFDGRILELDDGSILEVDFIVSGIGVTPRTELAEKAGLTVVSQHDGGGVVVNQRLETSAPDVYAIGDIANYPDRYVDRSIRVEHWVHAQRQGQHVARVLMGQATDYADLPFFWSAHFDTGLLYLGHADKPGDPKVEGSIDSQEFIGRYFGEGKDEAVVTCNRDQAALKTEAEWEASGSNG